MQNSDHRLGLEYEVLRRRRLGALGSVYEVRHRLLHEVRLVKLVRAEADRFVRGARTASLVAHPALINLRGHWQDADGRSALVFENLEGVDLEAAEAAMAPMEIGLCLEMARQALSAIAHLHRCGMVHGQIGPRSFVVLNSKEQELVVKLVDLAVSRVLGPVAVPPMNRIQCSAPELLSSSGKSRVEAAADIFSFGALLYRLLTGHWAFAGDEPATALRSRVEQGPQPLSASDPDGRIPQDLAALVNRCMATSPQQRPATAQAVLDEVERLLRRLPPTDSACAPLFVFCDRQASSEELQPSRDLHFDEPPEVDPVVAAAVNELLPAETPPKPLGSSADQREKRDLDIVARAVLVSARSMIGRGELEAAAAKLRHLIRMDPHSTELRSLLDRTEQDLAAQRLLSRREAEVRSVVQRIEGLVHDGDREGAREAIALAIEIYGPESNFDELKAAVGDSEGVVRLDEHLAYARRSLESNELRQTLDSLRHAGELEPGGGRIQELMQATMRRHAETTVAAYLQERDVAEAWRALAVAEKLFGSYPELQDLRRRLQEMTRENTLDAVNALLVSARILVDAGDHRGALQQLRRAGTVDAGNQEVRELTRATLERHAEATVAEYLERGAADDARVALSVARKRFGASLGLLAYDLELSSVGVDPGKTGSSRRETSDRQSPGVLRLRWKKRQPRRSVIARTGRRGAALTRRSPGRRRRR